MSNKTSLKYPYNNRELSWMDFNGRVLEEAFEKDNPIMERINFLSITASNLDEFFMVRVAGVMEQIHSKYTEPDVSGLTPQELMARLTEKIHTFTEKQYSCLHRSIVPALKRNNISFLTIREMNKKQLVHIEEYFDKILFPVLTPLAVDRSRPFPLLANKSLNIAVRLKKTGNQTLLLCRFHPFFPAFWSSPATKAALLCCWKASSSISCRSCLNCMRSRLTVLSVSPGIPIWISMKSRRT